MAKIIGLPKLSPTMEEGTLVRWVKQEGESVEVDDLIAEVETDKATMEFRSFDRGVLLKQLAAEGDTLSPDQPVAIVGDQGENIEALLQSVGQGGGGEAAPPQEAEQGTGETKAAAQPAEAPSTTATAAPLGEAEPAGAAQSGAQAGARVFASPAVRKVAREQSIDLHAVAGSGPHGRVVLRDLESVGERRVGLPGAPLRGPSVPPPGGRAPTSVSVPSASAAGAPAEGLSSLAPQAAGDRAEKLSQMRKAIARRLSESKREVPHFYLTVDIDAEPISALREALNHKLAASGEKVSLNDLLIKGCAVAIRRMPRVNVSFGGDTMLWHPDVNISVAVAVPDGLVTPVIRRADRLGVLEIAHQVRDFAARAKDKKLKPEEMQGGTFSISNLGMFGIDAFSAVINPPEGAIVAVGAVRDEPVVRDGAVVAGKRLSLTMSCDHRVIDGAVGAEWLKLLRGILEAPLSMLL